MASTHRIDGDPVRQVAQAIAADPVGGLVQTAGQALQRAATDFAPVQQALERVGDGLMRVFHFNPLKSSGVR